LQVLPQDPPILDKPLDLLSDLQTYLLICIHLSLGPAAGLSESSRALLAPLGHPGNGICYFIQSIFVDQ
jgi:hypothetical protein